MPEHNSFKVKHIHGRSIVRLRVRPSDANAVSEMLQLPQKSLQWYNGNPATYWLGPDQWLLTSDKKSVVEILDQIAVAIPTQLYAATDLSSGNVCFSLRGPAARTVLAMGCGIDMHESAITTGQCVRTRFAQIQLFIVSTGKATFDLYVDRSHAHYLQNWLQVAGEDPITQRANLFHAAYGLYTASSTSGAPARARPLSTERGGVLKRLSVNGLSVNRPKGLF